MPTRRELSDAYQAVSQGLLNQAGDLARNAFLNLPDWRDTDKNLFIQIMTGQLSSIKRQAANLALAYNKEIAKISDQPYKVPVVKNSDLTTEALRNGATAEVVYARPFTEMRTALSKGLDLTTSLKRGAFRAVDLARTEVQLARRNAGLISRQGNNRVVGYLRVLSGSENCALCYVASTQRYNRGDLLPIHPGCDCGEMEIYGNTDTGQIIDQERLDATHQAILDRFGRFDVSAREIDYRQIQIHDHGELGPVLTVRGQTFTGPDDI